MPFSGGRGEKCLELAKSDHTLCPVKSMKTYVRRHIYEVMKKFTISPRMATWFPKFVFLHRF